MGLVDNYKKKNSFGKPIDHIFKKSESKVIKPNKTC